VIFNNVQKASKFLAAEAVSQTPLEERRTLPKSSNWYKEGLLPRPNTLVSPLPLPALWDLSSSSSGLATEGP